jgi:hypothetical protein
MGLFRGWNAGEVAGPVRVTQTFTTGASGLHAVSFAAVPTGMPSEYLAEVTLASLGPNPPVTLADLRVPVARLVEDEWYRIAFPPMNDSSAQTFALTIAVPDAPPGRGIAVRAVKGDYDFGEFAFNGRTRWGALRLVTEASGATYLGRFRARAARWPSSVVTSVGALIAWIGFHFLAVLAVVSLFPNDGSGVAQQPPQVAPSALT